MTETAKVNSLSPSVFAMLCRKLVEIEHLTSDTKVIVMATTRPITNMIAVDFAYSASGDVGPERLPLADKLDAEYRDSFQPERIDVPSPGVQCHWEAARGDYSSYLYSDSLLLEVSSPVPNPYADGRNEPFGVFARFSVGGRAGAGWYWIALRPEGREWTPLRVVPLDISDG